MRQPAQILPGGRPPLCGGPGHTARPAPWLVLAVGVLTAPQARVEAQPEPVTVDVETALRARGTRSPAGQRLLVEVGAALRARGLRPPQGLSLSLDVRGTLRARGVRPDRREAGVAEGLLATGVRGEARELAVPEILTATGLRSQGPSPLLGVGPPAGSAATDEGPVTVVLEQGLVLSGVRAEARTAVLDPGLGLSGVRPDGVPVALAEALRLSGVRVEPVTVTLDAPLTLSGVRPGAPLDLTLEGSLAATGVRTGTVDRVLDGTLTATGMRAGSVGLALEGTLTAAGVRSAQRDLSLDGTLTASGVRPEARSHLLAGTLAASGIRRRTPEPGATRPPRRAPAVRTAPLRFTGAGPPAPRAVRTEALEFTGVPPGASVVRTGTLEFTGVPSAAPVVRTPALEFAGATGQEEATAGFELVRIVDLSGTDFFDPFEVREAFAPQAEPAPDAGEDGGGPPPPAPVDLTARASGVCGTEGGFVSATLTLLAPLPVDFAGGPVSIDVNEAADTLDASPGALTSFTLEAVAGGYQADAAPSWLLNAIGAGISAPSIFLPAAGGNLVEDFTVSRTSTHIISVQVQGSVLVGLGGVRCEFPS